MAGKILYLGTDISRYPWKKNVEHVPIIATKQRSYASLQKPFSKLALHKNVLFTSPKAAIYFFAVASYFQLSWENKTFFVVGEGTKAVCKEKTKNILVAKTATQEGVILLLERINEGVFWPKSSIARLALQRFLEKKTQSSIVDLYDTRFLRVSLCFANIDKLIFTSCSTVDAFFALYPNPTTSVCFVALGPITFRYLLSKYPRHSIVKAF